MDISIELFKQERMNSTYPTPNLTQTSTAKANQLLKKSTQVLFMIAVIGQLFFVVHIVSYYGSSIFTGDYEHWNKLLANGLVEGDVIGNIVLMMHIFLAAVITFGGPLQFIPKVRSNYPTFHRWNGRVYTLTAILISLAGLYMVFMHGVIGGNIMAMGNTLNASLIIIFAILTWRTAVSRDFTAHKRWAIRAFLVVSGVWFFRIGFGIWIAINFGSAPGSTEDLSGPFDMFLAFAHTLIPLAILELYFFTKQKNSSIVKYAMATFLLVLSGLLAVGIIMTTMIFWMPS